MLDGMEVPKNDLFVAAEASPTGSTPKATWTEAFNGLVDSSGCSTETEGSEEDDDFMAGLAEQMAHSMLDDCDDKTSGEVEYSTGLWEESWRTIQKRSSSSTAASEANQLKTGWSSSCWSPGYRSSSSSSPPSTPGAVDDGWDVNSVNAGFDDKSTSSAWRGQHASHHLAEVQWAHASLHDSSLSKKSSGGTLPVLTKPYAAAVNPHRAWRNKDEERHQIQTQQSRVSVQSTPDIWSRQQHNRCRQQQQESQQSSGVRPGYKCGMTQRGSMNHHHPWQPLPNANGSGMRAVFLGGSSDRSSSGTGVFLPRSTNDYSSSKRKTTCSTVLLPSRIVQVLNLNVEDMRCQPPSHNSGNGPPVPPLSGSRWANSTPAEENLPSGQWKTYTTCTQLHQPSELRLPTEWSY